MQKLQIMSEEGFMRIVFCSTHSGQTGTTSNLIAIASYLSILKSRQVFLIQTQFKTNDLDHILLGHSGLEELNSENGIDALIRMIKSEPISKDMIDSCSVDVYKKRLHLLPSSIQKESSIYETTISPMLIYCINAINQYCDITMVDAGVIKDIDNSPLLFAADVVVMDVSQNPQVLRKSIALEKTSGIKFFYLFGNYDPISKYNYQALHRTYGFPVKRTGTILYNTMFKDAIYDGEVLKFIAQICDSTRDEMNYEFFHMLETTAQKILEYGACREKAQCNVKRTQWMGRKRREGS